MTDLAYRLVRAALPAAVVPVLDPSQQAVVDHRGGPLLVLAGPGTGKTTTLVEAVAARVRDGARPDQVLVLTFSRKAAAELRDRITSRLGRTTGSPAAWTFHSFAYALVRAYQPAELFAGPLRLLTGPEQQVAVRELLAGSPGTGRAGWPEALRAALDTRGFAEQVRAVMSRARELGLEPDGLAELAEQTGRADWTAVAEFLGEYLEVLDAQGALDYAELVHRAVLLAERPDVRAALRARFSAVFVDEYQDTDPAQERLLQALAGDGRDLVAVGDPDQSIYAFRGADVAAILEFRERFPRADGSPAPVAALATSRRAGATLLAASRALTTRMGLRALPAEAVRRHRAVQPAVGLPPGEVAVRTYSSAGAELDAVADMLRRAHLEDGLAWSSMAVLVRSGVRSVPLVRRVLGAAGVPVEVAGDELPLAREPAVAPLLLALRCAADPRELTTERARGLLVSPLGGADAGTLRRLGRALRAEERAVSLTETGVARLPRPSAELIRDALADPRQLVAFDDRVAGAARRLGLLLAEARELLAGGGSPEEALWVLWDGTGWSRRVQRAAAGAGDAAALAADRDLDAVCALFDAAARAEEQVGHRGARNLLEELEAQQIPGDTLAERPVRGDAVRVLTAHRAKGLEWDLVAVPGVQEGVWPDLRRRGSLLEPDRLERDGLGPPSTPGVLLSEERRLFYVAITRARRRLLVSAVASGDDDGERPSRLLGELGVPVEEVLRRRVRPLSVAGLVAELRAVCVDPATSPALRSAATRRLAGLASATGAAGEPLVPAADPGRWWGMRELTDPGLALHPAGVPVRMSGSSLSGIDVCALRWFLEHEAHAESARTTALGFGSVVHVLAHEVAQGRLPARIEDLLARLDQVWGELAFEARWQSEQQREQARLALERFLVWHRSRPERHHVASEAAFEVELSTAHGPVALRGSIDRVERDDAGRVHVVDFKTGKSAASGDAVQAHPQLGVYQRAVVAGALDGVLGVADDVGSGAVHCELGGAELVQLRLDGPFGAKVQRQAALPADAPTWVDDLLGDAVGRLVAEDFAPTPNDGCDRCAFHTSCPAQPEGRQVVS